MLKLGFRMLGVLAAHGSVSRSVSGSDSFVRPRCPLAVRRTTWFGVSRGGQAPPRGPCVRTLTRAGSASSPAPSLPGPAACASQRGPNAGFVSHWLRSS